MSPRVRTASRRLIAARAIVSRLRPPHPAAWLDLSDEEHARKVTALKLATRRVEELCSARAA